MKIAIDARMLGHRLHGLGRFVWSTAGHVARQAPTDQIVMLGASPLAHELAGQLPNLRVQPLSARPFSIREQWQLPLTLLRVRPQLFHATSTAISVVRPVPYVMTIPDLIPLLFHGDRWRYRLYFRHWLPWVARRARRVLAFSEAAREDMCRHLGLPASHIGVVPLGVDPTFTTTACPDEVDRLAARYDVRAPYVLTAGNPRPHKNLPRALEVLDRLLPLLEDRVHVVVLSAPGPLLESAVARFSQPSRLRHVTYVEEQDLPALYRQCHAFFYPSLYEGFGLQVLEAMACGSVVVTSAAASLREVAGEGALQVDVSDTTATLETLRAACTDEGLRSQLRGRATAQASGFTWEQCAARTLQVYQGAV